MNNLQTFLMFFFGGGGGLPNCEWRATQQGFFVCVFNQSDPVFLNYIGASIKEFLVTTKTIHPPYLPNTKCGGDNKTVVPPPAPPTS